jgi:Protein of unknown function (DUF2800)
MNPHFFLAPSAAGCTVHCPAAPMLQARYPEDEEHPVTKEGIAMHWLASQILARGPGAIPVGTVAPNGVTLDRELVDATTLYTDDVREAQAKYPHGVVSVEATLHNAALHPTANGGTPDSWILVPQEDGRILVILWDFKGGHGLVEVFENWQLINYAALILTELFEADDQRVTFEFRIIQPRAHHPDGPIRTWRVNASHLRGQFNRLTAAYEAATQPEPEAKPGAHCKTAYCTAAGRGCAALAAEAWRVVDVAYAPQPHDLTPANLGLSLRIMERAKKMLDAHVEGMRTQALAMLTRGDAVPYYKVTQGLGREVIRDDKVQEFIICGEALGVSVAKPAACVTPKQARSAGMPAEVVALYSEQRKGENKLTPDDGIEARKVFGK